MPAELGDERAAVAQSALDVSGEGLVAPEHDQLGEGDGLAPEWIDEGGDDSEAEDPAVPREVPVSLDSGGIAEPGEASSPLQIHGRGATERHSPSALVRAVRPAGVEHRCDLSARGGVGLLVSGRGRDLAQLHSLLQRGITAAREVLELQPPDRPSRAERDLPQHALPGQRAQEHVGPDARPEVVGCLGPDAVERVVRAPVPAKLGDQRLVAPNSCRSATRRSTTGRRPTRYRARSGCAPGEIPRTGGRRCSAAARSRSGRSGRCRPPDWGRRSARRGSPSATGSARR